VSSSSGSSSSSSSDSDSSSTTITTSCCCFFSGLCGLPMLYISIPAGAGCSCCIRVQQ
jgi:hypothetical protein